MRIRIIEYNIILISFTVTTVKLLKKVIFYVYNIICKKFLYAILIK